MLLGGFMSDVIEYGPEVYAAALERITNGLWSTPLPAHGHVLRDLFYMLKHIREHSKNIYLDLYHFLLSDSVNHSSYRVFIEFVACDIPMKILTIEQVITMLTNCNDFKLTLRHYR